jgi:hypothetical protein
VTLKRGAGRVLSWALWLLVPVVVAVGIWFIQNRPDALPEAVQQLPEIESTQGTPTSCDEIESAVIQVAEENLGPNSPLRWVEVKDPRPTPTAPADNGLRDLALAQWAAEGTLVYPTLQCDAVGVLPDGTEQFLFVAIGSTAQSVEEKVIRVMERMWLSDQEAQSQNEAFEAQMEDAGRQWELDADLRSAGLAIDAYYEENGRYPEAIDDVQYQRFGGGNVVLRSADPSGFCIDISDPVTGEIPLHWDSINFMAASGPCP